MPFKSLQRAPTNLFKASASFFSAIRCVSWHLRTSKISRGDLVADAADVSLKVFERQKLSQEGRLLGRTHVLAFLASNPWISGRKSYQKRAKPIFCDSFWL